jgi:transcriptional regulator with XRE-family HTH domain
MRKTPIPDSEKRIGRRLKELRLMLGLSEKSAARLAGITPHLWHSVEMQRAPLKCHVGFRICRQLIVSEEWLATGGFAQLEECAAKRSIGKSRELDKFYFRQCVDLQAEPEFLDLQPGTFFSSAYQSMKSKYGALADAHFYLPRLVIRDADADELLIRYLSVINERWLWLLENEARRTSRGQGSVRRQFLRCQVEIGSVLFKRFMGFETPEIKGHAYDYLRALAADSKHPVGPIHGENK